jgi:hypothetical protein
VVKATCCVGKQACATPVPGEAGARRPGTEDAVPPRAAACASGVVVWLGRGELPVAVAGLAKAVLTPAAFAKSRTS